MNCPQCGKPKTVIRMDSRPNSPKGYVCADCGITWEPGGTITYHVAKKTPDGDQWTWHDVPQYTLWICAEESLDTMPCPCHVSHDTLSQSQEPVSCTNQELSTVPCIKAGSTP